ncbi:helix-turn-helix domain-containing protein [Nocardiopsis sp. L17-MgMaSL7]|uniref:helix-turn-helix domain-containing protein n=1 Tax=Nocardiopsis sp. L17-MgMaSL7 TaxID=1938893 RepID=UPI00351A913B
MVAWFHGPQGAPCGATALFGLELRRLRELLGMSQSTLGKVSGMSKRRIGAVERGIRCPSKFQSNLRVKRWVLTGGFGTCDPELKVGAVQAGGFVELQEKARFIYEFQPQATWARCRTRNYALAVCKPPASAHAGGST